MKFGRQFHAEPEPIQMVPLIDVLFVTLFFFMVVSAYTSIESDIDVSLPTASNAAQQKRLQGEIYINLRKDGHIVLNEREMGLPELQEVLNRVAELFPGGAVIIRGDQQAALGQAVAILDCCARADIQNVSFAALAEESTEGPKR
jgi:biopolymer transport protein ExbD